MMFTGSLRLHFPCTGGAHLAASRAARHPCVLPLTISCAVSQETDPTRRLGEYATMQIAASGLSEEAEKSCDFEESREAAVKLQIGGTAPPLVKFPRTRHLIDLGAATSDDKISKSRSYFYKGPVVIEEKIDGANMGISLDNSGSLVVQNRSHTITSRSHAQFRNLDAWLFRHSDALFSILYRDEQFSQRHILYGEWVVATHSISYSNLPDAFLAFDLYDRVTNTFASREILSRLLHDTGLKQVPLICSREDGVSRQELVSYMSRTSAFYNGPVEGVYVRFEDPARQLTVDRGKVVRADFVAGSEQWKKGIVRLNGITDNFSSYR